MDGTEHDQAEIDQLVARFFAAFDNRDGAAPVDSLREVCLPQALIIKNSGSSPEVYDLEAFIAPRVALLADGTLTGFHETELESRSEVHGRIAQRLSLYSKSGVLEGARFTTRGIKCIQAVRTPAGWRISSVTWDDERPGFSVPTVLDPHGAKP